MAPDTSRVILHCDVDAFYAQVEEIRDPRLRSVPMAIQQKFICVTANYPARARGVGKLMVVAEAQKLCPELVLVSGEDLTPYRAVAAEARRVLGAYGVLEKLGLDEAYLDITTRCRALVSSGQPLTVVGHLHAAKTGTVASNRYRVMDIAAAPGAAPLPSAALTGPDALLAAGSMIAAEARAALFAQLQLRASAGVAHNKMLAKLVSGLHKPNDQTVLLSSEAEAFVAPLPLRALRGVGSVTQAALESLGVTTCAHLRAVPRDRLARALGSTKQAGTLAEAAYGRDATPVQASADRKSVV